MYSFHDTEKIDTVESDISEEKLLWEIEMIVELLQRNPRNSDAELLSNVDKMAPQYLYRSPNFLIEYRLDKRKKKI